MNKFDALNDITSVNNSSSVINENKVELIFISAILALAKNMRVVTQMDNKIKVLEIESNNESVEVSILDGYCSVFKDKIINANREVIK